MSARGQLFSPFWYKVRGLKPRLRPNVQITRIEERGTVWRVLSNPETGRHFRYPEAAHAIIGALDGQRTLEELWQAAAARLGDDLPTQEEVIGLVGQLNRAGALLAGAAPVLEELAERSAETRRREQTQRWLNPLFLRIPLFDPDRFLTLTAPLARPLFTIWGLIAWLGLLVWSVRALALRWSALTTTLADRVLAADNLVVLAVVFPLAKLLHELAHGYAVKVWGGEVRETGIMLLIFMPVPYVDASAASAFPSRRRRIIVSAAGMMAELVLAALALAVWSAAEPGLVRAIAFNTLVIAGVSTLFFNGNPLLRFDAYFILMDLIGVQNLGSRAPRWWGWLLHRFGFGLKRWPDPARDRYEAVWFALYQPLSYAYRLWLTFSIALFVASSYFALGVALAVWSIGLTIMLPLGRGLWHVATGAGVAPRRGRALGVVAALGALLVAGLTLIPVPHGTVVQGVVRAPEAGAITAATDGTLDASARLSAGAVEAGRPVLTVEDPLAAAELRVLAARVRVAAARLRAAEARAADERSGAGIAVAQATYRYREAEYRDREAEEAARRVDAPIDGVFVATPDRLAAGRPVRRGEIIGHVLDARTTRVQVAIPVSAIELVRRSPERVAVRFADRPRHRLAGHVTAMAPEPTHQLPAPALAQQAGGPFALDPADPEGRASLTAFVLSEVIVVSPDPLPPLGARVYVRFDHGAPPLWQRLARGLRQLFLAELGV